MSLILYPPSNPVAFGFLNIQVHWYGIIMALSMLIGISVASYFFDKYVSKKDCDNFIDLIPIVIICAVLGARIFYVIGDWGFYSKHITEIFLINHGGLSIFGALLFAISTIFIYSKTKKFSCLKYLDIMALSMPLCQSIGRWGNFINQEAYGAPYNGFLKMYIAQNHRVDNFFNVEYYHPTFLYESVLDFILFILLVIIFLKFKNIKAGTIFALYLLLYSFIRIFVENIRIDSVLNVSNIPIAIIISILTILVSLFLLFGIYKK
ncbi:MAG: prolipoprotein diacylglyceryl transferase [Candidatus Gastranaerophilales bacterium]|nr:prolipoprotein diacylglyceryl transferase [Candidatus Gastranaerophilales bacterium]